MKIRCWRREPKALPSAYRWIKRQTSVGDFVQILIRKGPLITCRLSDVQWKVWHEFRAQQTNTVGPPFLATDYDEQLCEYLHAQAEIKVFTEVSLV